MASDRTPKKGLVLANGNRLSHGQLFLRKDTTTMTVKSLDPSSPLHPRNGSAKRTVEAQPVVGQKRREEKGGHPLLPNARRPLDDEPLEKKFLDGKTAPIHPGMGSKTMSERGTDKGRDHGSAILQEASRLGNAPEKA